LKATFIDEAVVHYEPFPRISHPRPNAQGWRRRIPLKYISRYHIKILLVQCEMEAKIVSFFSAIGIVRPWLKKMSLDDGPTSFIEDIVHTSTVQNKD
jgi:hypothetical protein